MTMGTTRTMGPLETNAVRGVVDGLIDGLPWGPGLGYPVPYLGLDWRLEVWDGDDDTVDVTLYASNDLVTVAAGREGVGAGDLYGEVWDLVVQLKDER